jgi:rubrerythrin
MNENDFNKLIDFAIDQENQAFAFYTSAAEKVSNPGVKKIFKELAQDENGHANLLEMWRNNKALAAVFKIEALDYKIAETQDMPELSLALSPAEAKSKWQPSYIKVWRQMRWVKTRGKP